MTTTQTPPLEDDMNQLRDELAASPTRIGWLRAHIDEQADSLCFNLSTHLGCEPSDDAVVDAVQSLIGQIDAQSVRLEAAERDAVRADVAMLRGSRKVLWNLLGECLPLLHQIECHDAESDERLGFLIGQIEAARSQVQAEELPGRI